MKFQTILKLIHSCFTRRRYQNSIYVYYVHYLLLNRMNDIKKNSRDKSRLSLSPNLKIATYIETTIAPRICKRVIICTRDTLHAASDVRLQPTISHWEHKKSFFTENYQKWKFSLSCTKESVKKTEKRKS